MTAMLFACLLLSPQTGGVPTHLEPKPLNMAWIVEGGQRSLFVLAEDASGLITGMDIQPTDRAWVVERDLNGDGKMDVDIHVQAETHKTIHHVIIDENFPPVLPLGGGGGDLTVVDLVSDKDNFGFGASDPPCSFFDNSDSADVGVFDRELGAGDEIESWVHDLSEFGIDEAPILVTATLEIRELFSDPGEDSTLTIELSQPLSFEADGSDCSGGCICDFGTVHTFTITTSDVRFLRDLTVPVSFMENNDDIGLDYAELTLDITFE